MNRYLSFFVIMMILAGCYQDAPESSFDMNLVLSQDSMVVLMTDLQLVDGAVNVKSRGNQLMEEYSSAYTRQVLEKHNLSHEVFSESMRYYSYHVEKMDEIYEQVIIRLGTIESEAYQEDQRE